MAERRKTALVVEDDEKVRAMVKKYLERMGFDVVEVVGGKAAMAQLGRLRPDFVCLDLMLPESSGFEVCEFIRRHDDLRETPVLVISARAQPADRAAAEESGASAYLVKPFTLRQFTAQVAALLPSDG